MSLCVCDEGVCVDVIRVFVCMCVSLGFLCVCVSH